MSNNYSNQYKTTRKPQNFNLSWSRQQSTSDKPMERCPYCSAKDIVKRGLRKKKQESVQLYKCKNCERTFTPQIIKHKQYPLKIILDAISTYNLGYSGSETCKIIKEKYGKDLKQPTLSVNVKRGLQQKADRGWLPNNPPIGYLNKDGKIVKDPKRFDLVRKIFDLALEEIYTLQELTDKAEEIGLRSKRNKIIILSHVHKILNNHFYYGKFEWPAHSGNLYEGKHEPMITAIEFQRVRNYYTRKNVKRYVKNKFIYTGTMKCKQCGGAITASRVLKKLKNGNVNEHIYYHCAKTKDRTCQEKSYPVNEKQLEKQIIEMLDKISVPKDLFKWAMNEMRNEKKTESAVRDKAKAEYRREKDQISKKIDKLIDMMTEGLITKEEFSQKRKKAQLERDYFEEKLAGLDNEADILIDKIEEIFDFVIHAKKDYREGDPETKRKILLKLDSNLQLCEKKLLISLNLKLKPFLKYSSQLIEEFSSNQTGILNQYKDKTGTFAPACPSLPGGRAPHNPAVAGYAG
jgi:transposase-like protein